MKKLKYIAPPHIDRYRLIVEKKKVPEIKARLKAADGSIYARYTEFEFAVRDNTIKSFAEDGALQALELDLRSCYATKTSGLKSILAGIKTAQIERQLEKCPYCGITLPTTHDHYLPAGKYPELAVHGLNLVPCCSSCNEIKGDRWQGASQRLFIHYYSDKIPESSFLTTELMPTPNKSSLGAKFSITRPPETLAEEWAIVQNHFDKLGLLKRYQDAANDEIANALDACVDHICEGGQDASRFLSRTEGRLATIFGKSHWRASLYRALAGNPVFLAIVASKAALENLAEAP